MSDDDDVPRGDVIRSRLPRPDSSMRRSIFFLSGILSEEEEEEERLRRRREWGELGLSSRSWELSGCVCVPVKGEVHHVVELGLLKEIP